MKSVFFIPVFNQIKEFPKVLNELRDVSLPCSQILLINNGSFDGTEQIIRKSGYPFIDVDRNMGTGYSYMLAADWALARSFDILGVLAGNGKMLPSEMHRVLDPIADGRADYTVGSRFLPGGSSPNLPLFRRFAIPAIVNILVRVLYGVQLTDATCGYRAWRLELMTRAQFDWHAPWLNTYGFEYYFYAKVLLNKTIRKIEVPITMRYPTSGPYSKIKPLTGWWSMLKPWIVARFDGAMISETRSAQ